MLRSFTTLLGWIALRVAAIQHTHQHDSGLLVDISKYRLQTDVDYVKAQDLSPSNSRVRLAIRSSDYVDTATSFVKSIVPSATFRVLDGHYLGNDGIGHVYFKQTINGLDVDNGDFNVNIAQNGSIFSYGSSFYIGPTPSLNLLVQRDAQDPINALSAINNILGLSIVSASATVEANSPDSYVIKGTEGTRYDPKAQLAYLQMPGNKLELAWRVDTYTTRHELSSYIDAINFHELLAVINYRFSASYEVYPWGLNDPTEGERQVLNDPWDLTSSRHTWQGDGQTTYTSTRGNNIVANVNWAGTQDENELLNSYRPDSANQNFVFPYSPSMSDFKSYADASVTQMFYTANMYHDLLYELGFDEQSRNFQMSNDGKGGVEGDYVLSASQDGQGMNNAYFSTRKDGQPGQMHMYMWNFTAPQRDGAFCADIVIHEYTHGLSNRLTGAPKDDSCLQSTSAGGMGEGWSDFYATAVRIKTTDTHDTNYAMGAWAVDKPMGIRKYVYSTNMTTNPHVYKDTFSMNEVHKIGTVWATILYDALWNMIDAHGITSNIRPQFDANGVATDGRFLAMQLVMNGMRYQPCNPNFVQARDAILDAEQALTHGANSCALWKAFAKRGLGDGASSGFFASQSFKIKDGVCK